MTAADESVRDGREAIDFLYRHGYRRCDIPACNCGSWHGGRVRQRLDEIKDALVDADIDLTGKTILSGVQELAARSSTLSASEGWVCVQSRLPEPDTGEVLVWLTGGRAAFDEWHTYREDPTGMGGATIDMGLMWRDYDFQEITHWMPLPAAPQPPAESEQARVCPTFCANDTVAEQCGVPRGTIFVRIEDMAPESFAELKREVHLQIEAERAVAPQPEPTAAKEPTALEQSVDAMVRMLEDGEWAEHVSTIYKHPLATRLEAAITKLHNDIHEASEPTAAKEGAPVECETCQGVGTIDERLGGECFSNPAAACPDCDGAGEWTPAAPEPATPLAGQQADPGDYGTLALLAFVEAIAKCEGGMIDANNASAKAKRAISRYYETRHISTTAATEPATHSAGKSAALAAFTEYFVKNYPGPDTIIHDPHWHAPRIFRAAAAALTQRDQGEKA